MSSRFGVAPSWGRRVVGIEGLRALAALLVVFHHTAQIGVAGDHLGPLANWGRHGLTLFFALSGFLLYRPFATALARNEPLPKTVSFLINRWLRIVPGYVAVFVLANFVLQSLRTSVSGEGLFSYGVIVSPVKLLASLFLIQPYSPATIGTGIFPAWSLAVEIVFYLALPLFAGFAALLCNRMMQRWWALLLPPTLFFVIGVVGKVWAQSSIDDSQNVAIQQWGANWHSVLERSFLVNADLFSWGMVAAVIVVGARELAEARITRIRSIAWVVGPIFLVITMFLRGDSWARVQDMAASVVSAAVILVVSLPGRGFRVGLLARLLEWAPIRYVGLVSFSLYLWHAPVLVLLRRLGVVRSGGDAALLLDFAVATVVTVVLATATYWLVERPALRLKRRVAPASSVVVAEDDRIEPLAAP